MSPVTRSLKRAGDEEPAPCEPSTACGKEPLAPAPPGAESPSAPAPEPLGKQRVVGGSGVRPQRWCGLPGGLTWGGPRGPPVGWACACGVETGVGVTCLAGERGPVPPRVCVCL